ncbi:response regulator transcription factor [Pedosphaera parvula]|uniref:Response regulator receiver protein n=1 Tax=Pedosphaera parvula (strain Ellin514) TaxID=320771 RepID=B9XDL9_PEDPL|nr:response regulator [Pedosphaera parvula]EEF62165.1 response regulator receiver protein [Pedosphaera parvula Ellin514]
MSSTQKILVADDSLTIRKLVEGVLTKDGYEVVTAVSGADCLAKAVSEKPTLILLDYILPDMQGTEVCRSLINSPDTWEIPVLMMSSNGTAIRQLYQDLNNVADYLTKPFAPSVLKAVIGQLLRKEMPAEHGETSTRQTTAQSEPPAVAPQVENAVPSAFMDKVTRLLSLMENAPAVAASVEKVEKVAPEKEPAPAAQVRKTKSRRPAKKVSITPIGGDALLRKLKLAVQKHLRPLIRQIPEWEASRGNGNAEDYFLHRLLAKAVLQDLSADVLRATGALSNTDGAWRCPSALVTLDAGLRHVHASRATGELRIEMGEETVLAYFENGKALLLTTNHPRQYCAGAAYDFQSLPHAAITEAVKAQEEQGLPFFVSLQAGGHLPQGTPVDELLRAQGEKCLARAFQSRESLITFLPLAQLPPMALAHRLDVPITELLLACYRSVDDWFIIDKALPEKNTILVSSVESGSEHSNLPLNDEESCILEAIRPGRTIIELTEGSKLKPFEVYHILFCLLKLGLIRSAQNSAPGTEKVASLPSPSESEDARLNEQTSSVLDNGNSESSMTEAVPSSPVAVSNEHDASQRLSELSEVLKNLSPVTEEQTSFSGHTHLETKSPKMDAVPSCQVTVPNEHDAAQVLSEVSELAENSSPVAEEQTSSSSHAHPEKESPKTDADPSSPVAVPNEHETAQVLSEVSELAENSSPVTEEQTSSSIHAHLETESPKTDADLSSSVAALDEQDAAQVLSEVSELAENSSPVAEEQTSSSGHARPETESPKTDAVPSIPVAGSYEQDAAEILSEVSELVKKSSPVAQEKTSSFGREHLVSSAPNMVAASEGHDVFQRLSVVSNHDLKDSSTSTRPENDLTCPSDEHAGHGSSVIPFPGFRRSDLSA